MNLTETPDVKQWPRTHYVFVERIGPFQETAGSAWQTLHEHLQEIYRQCEISGYFAIYKMKPVMMYRAGVAVNVRPMQLPAGFEYMEFEGGKYSQFVFTGPYSNMPEAYNRVFQSIRQLNIPIRDAFYIENYVNDPKTTPADQLITEILIPTE